MNELLKNVLYLSAGAVFLTKDKIEALKGELIGKGKMTQEEGKQFVDELVKKSEAIKEQLEERIQQVVAEQLKKMNVATHDDIAALSARIDELAKVVDKGQSEE
ncbi:poly(hydroxyalcanoate) granule associated protein [bacterium BMS3Bbin14]|nr:poly(hydroxyalcanoate) granule associated protein [bacterium BMS3Abin13]GBE51817.1 poly(hydroxyalcanoate) granule associated protein [bacterium BMS3Bbin14]